MMFLTKAAIGQMGAELAKRMSYFEFVALADVVVIRCTLCPPSPSGEHPQVGSELEAGRTVDELMAIALNHLGEAHPEA